MPFHMRKTYHYVRVFVTNNNVSHFEWVIIKNWNNSLSKKVVYTYKTIRKLEHKTEGTNVLCGLNDWIQTTKSNSTIFMSSRDYHLWWASFECSALRIMRTIKIGHVDKYWALRFIQKHLRFEILYQYDLWI